MVLFGAAIVLFVVAVLHQNVVIKCIDPSKATTKTDYFAEMSHTLPSRSALTPKGQRHYDLLGRYMAAAVFCAAMGVANHLWFGL